MKRYSYKSHVTLLHNVFHFDAFTGLNQHCRRVGGDATAQVPFLASSSVSPFSPSSCPFDHSQPFCLNYLQASQEKTANIVLLHLALIQAALRNRNTNIPELVTKSRCLTVLYRVAQKHLPFRFEELGVEGKRCTQPSAFSPSLHFPLFRVFSGSRLSKSNFASLLACRAVVVVFLPLFKNRGRPLVK